MAASMVAPGIGNSTCLKVLTPPAIQKSPGHPVRQEPSGKYDEGLTSQTAERGSSGLIAPTPTIATKKTIVRSQGIGLKTELNPNKVLAHMHFSRSFQKVSDQIFLLNFRALWGQGFAGSFDQD
uniref:HDC02821 n=1 Tax=Drosophila melanogaster TaxID=7227 RepID=Q6IHB5_DROME|nr:TPA_inf: HDC02821 [Drosophila melanogaster]